MPTIGLVCQVLISMLYLVVAVDQSLRHNLAIAGVYLAYAIAGALMLTTLR
jgi:hypothetical protein